jgi:hypothetical protein
MLILVAVLMGLTALAATVSPPPDTARRDGPAAVTSPTATVAPQPGGGLPSEAGVLARTLDAAGLRKPVRIDVPLGALLDLTVTVGAPDTVALGELRLEVAAPESPARFQLLADAPGDYPLRLLESQRELGSVRVMPGARLGRG